MIYWLHLVGSTIVRFVPRTIAYWLVTLGAGPSLVFYRRHYRNALRNMSRVLSSGADAANVRGLVDRAFINYGKYMVDLLRLPRVTTDEIRRNIVVYGGEHIDEALSYGKGLVLVTGHIGNWDLAGATLAAMGYPVNAIVDTLEPKRWDAAVQAIRRHLGITPIPHEDGPKEMLRALRRNEILGILIDRPLAEDGVPVAFFGRETRVPGGAATLALRTGANVVTAVVVREGNHYIAHVDKMIRPDPTGDLPGDIEVLTQRIMSQLERWVRKYPDQWFMFRDMWPSAA